MREIKEAHLPPNCCLRLRLHLSEYIGLTRPRISFSRFSVKTTLYSIEDESHVCLVE